MACSYTLYLYQSLICEFTLQFECCGVNAATTTNDEFSNTVWAGSRGVSRVPYSCCKSATEDNYKTGSEPTCTTTLVAAQEKVGL